MPISANLYAHEPGLTVVDAKTNRCFLSYLAMAATTAFWQTHLGACRMANKLSNLIATRLAGKMQPTRQTSIFLPAQENQP